jgi:hypothetical protein
MGIGLTGPQCEADSEISRRVLALKRLYLNLITPFEVRVLLISATNGTFVWNKSVAASVYIGLVFR